MRPTAALALAALCSRSHRPPRERTPGGQGPRDDVAAAPPDEARGPYEAIVVLLEP